MIMISLTSPSAGSGSRGQVVRAVPGGTESGTPGPGGGEAGWPRTPATTRAHVERSNDFCR